jgi:hypothetical protein
MLQDGSLDTRTYAKRLLWGVKAALRGNRPDMDRLMAGGSKGFESLDLSMVTCAQAECFEFLAVTGGSQWITCHTSRTCTLSFDAPMQKLYFY